MGTRPVLLSLICNEAGRVLPRPTSLQDNNLLFEIYTTDYTLPYDTGMLHSVHSDMIRSKQF